MGSAQKLKKEYLGVAHNHRIITSKSWGGAQAVNADKIA
jgi:hypothetical protein